MKIVTLTLNPAFDIHCSMPELVPFHENLAEITARDAGGKGINISRALTACGVENTALAVIGSENGEDFAKKLSDEGIALETLTVPGRIRENFTFHSDGQSETRISFKGFSADENLLKRVEEKLSFVKSGDIVTFTGRNPNGLSIESVRDFVLSLRRRGALVVIDSRSFGISDLIECKPWLIKPNQEEISAYLGREINTLAEAMNAARELYGKGISNVMVSLGGDGAVLACKEGGFTAKAPEIEPLSTIGAGDSSVAGFITAYKNGLSPELCLKTAVAFGSAACLTEGTRPPKPEDVKRLFGETALN